MYQVLLFKSRRHLCKGSIFVRMNLDVCSCIISSSASARVQASISSNRTVSFKRPKPRQNVYMSSTSFPESLTLSHIMNKVTLSRPVHNSNLVVH